MEVWKNIAGIATHEVSNMGRVRSKSRISSVAADGLAGRPGITRYQRRICGRLLKLNNTYKNGKKSYSFASINDRTFSVHRLVAEAFLPRTADQDYVNHKDGNKHNNRADNLEWCTASENEYHAYNVLGKTPWNKGKHYDNTNAAAARSRNHLRWCMELLGEWRNGASKKSLSIKYNRCYRQICDNIQKAIKAEREVCDE